MHSIPLTSYAIVDGAQQATGTINHSPLTIGRMLDRDLVLESTYVSRKHAEIIYEDGAFYVIDMESRHGTFVNGIRVQRQRLSVRDVIHFGSMEGPMMRFGVEE